MYPIGHRTVDGKPIPPADQFAVIYDGKLYRDNYEEERDWIYALSGSKETIYVSGGIEFYGTP